MTLPDASAAPSASEQLDPKIAGLDGNTRRAIDIGVGEEVDAAAFKALVLAAVALNTAGKKAGKKAKRAK